jgi:PadR family transcriptional regulator PadR
LRKYYRITPAGLARLQEFQQEWAQMQQIYRFVTREEAKADD